MAIAGKVKSYLDNRHIVYDVHELPPVASLLQAAEGGGIAPGIIAKSTVLRDDLGTVLVVTAASHAVGADALSKLLHRRLALADEAQIKQAFPDCQPRFVPPLGEAYGVRTIVDESLMGLADVYFPAGEGERLLRVSGKDFFNLSSGAWLAEGFARPLAAPQEAATEEGQAPAETDIKRRVQRLTDLPAMPQLAMKIVELRADPNADAEKLAKLIELDPSLAAQVIRYARSPFFSYRGSVDSIRAAISRVLGFDMVMNLALGMATARAFRVPAIGPLGLNAFWRHATHSAALVQALGAEMPRPLRPSPGVGYLAGLLHNIGFLLLGHLFKREFCLLNSAVAERPEIPVQEHEHAQLGVDHTELGAWLLERWNMPDEIVAAVRHHHDVHYQGRHREYAGLVLLADRMLKGLNIGDAACEALPETVLEALGLEELQTVMVMGRILQGVEGLNVMARDLAAA